MSMRQEVIEVIDGISREWRYEGRALIYTVTSVRREAIDALMLDTEQNFASLPPGYHLHLLFDLSAPGVTMTPYYRQRVTEQQHYMEQFQGAISVAVVTPAGLFNRIFASVGDIFTRRASADRFSYRLFTRMDDALVWLDRNIAFMHGETQLMAALPQHK